MSLYNGFAGLLQLFSHVPGLNDHESFVRFIGKKTMFQKQMPISRPRLGGIRYGGW